MKEELYKILDSLGVGYDKRWNAEKLQRLIDEEKADEAATKRLEGVDGSVSVKVALQESPKKEEPYKIIATFKTRTIDGDRITHRYVGEGSIEEALNLTCEEPEETVGQVWPRGCNCLVNMKVKRGTYEFNRSIAPHVVRAILEDKNIPLFRRLFGI